MYSRLYKKDHTNNFLLNHNSRKNLKKAIRRHHKKIQNLITDAHYQIINDILELDFDYIILPNFNVSNMVKKGNRKIRKKTARQMMSWNHYKFRCRIKNACEKRGVKLVIGNEKYTSKTCPQCGWLNRNIGGAEYFICKHCGYQGDRDHKAGYLIFLVNLNSTCNVTISQESGIMDVEGYLHSMDANLRKLFNNYSYIMFV